MKTTSYLFVLSTLLASSFSFAHNLQLNANLPTVNVAQNGELNIVNGEIQYQNWNSRQLIGKVRIINHIAGRSSAKEKNEALIQRIKVAHFDRKKYQTTTIINADDAVMGTGVFVKSSAEKGKKANPHSQVILDQKGSVKNAWQLKEKENAVIVLDKTGKIQFVSEGKLSNGQIEAIINLVSELMK